MNIVNPQVEEYMASLQSRHDEPVLLEMEKEGRERGFPIVGRNVGVTLEVLARSIGARRVMELGSGFGYSAYWFAPAVGGGGGGHCPGGAAARWIAPAATRRTGARQRTTSRARVFGIASSTTWGTRSSRCPVSKACSTSSTTTSTRTAIRTPGWRLASASVSAASTSATTSCGRVAWSSQTPTGTRVRSSSTTG